MSGICGIVNLDGAPVDRELLQAMTDSMTFRGPDAQEIWADGNVGFGHTLLRTTFEAEHESQPFTLDNKVWITADARVDGRSELLEKLHGKRREVARSAPDAELIMHAYRVWGEDCIHHLIGDFAFAIWDGPRQRLFCARDQFGVKPLFYSEIGDSVIFSNTLNCIRVHPDVSDDLNDQAIGDFLLFDYNQDPGTTSFADIQRVPPAHYGTWFTKDSRLQRYWTLPESDGVRYRRHGDYVEHFRELLTGAVSDRLRTDHVGVSMSGGLDSSSVAATAHSLLADRSRPFDLRAQTVVYDRLISDQERYYSGLVAARLRIPIHYIAADNYAPFERCDEPAMHTPEPVNNPYLALAIDEATQMAVHSRVALTGWDGEALLSESPKPYLRALLKGCKFGRLLAGLGWYAALLRRRLAPRIRAKLKAILASPRQQERHYPAWFNPEFAECWDLRSRWTQLNATPAEGHPIRPYAYRVFSLLPLWQSIFSGYEADSTHAPIEYRHPFLDIRLVNYCLSVPPLPWCANKELLRRSMRNVLPTSVRLRPKTPLAGDPFIENLCQLRAEWLDDFCPTDELARYVNRAAVPRMCEARGSDEIWTNVRPFSLDCWLHGSCTTKSQVRPTRKVYEIRNQQAGAKDISEPQVAGLRQH